MAKNIRVMISSRCSDPIEFEGELQPLSAVRQALKSRIESEELFGDTRYECWINEDAPPADASQDSWEECLSQVEKADVVIVLYNGNAGWARDGGEIGICHAELNRALSSGAARARLVELPLIEDFQDAQAAERSQAFREFVERQSLFRGEATTTGEEVIETALDALREATVDLSRLGKRESRKGKYDTGMALDWSRLNYRDRQDAMTATGIDAITARDGARAEDGESFVSVVLESYRVLMAVHAVPAAMSVAAAREMVGRPFLRDHEAADLLDRKGGPVHVILCHKNVTERQATNLLGFPDATVVRSSFGIYIAGGVQHIQILFIKDCRDQTETRHAIQRAFEWLHQSGEVEHLVRRSRKRKRIVKAIAEEVE